MRALKLSFKLLIIKAKVLIAKIRLFVLRKI